MECFDIFFNERRSPSIGLSEFVLRGVTFRSLISWSMSYR